MEVTQKFFSENLYTFYSTDYYISPHKCEIIDEHVLSNSINPDSKFIYVYRKDYLMFQFLEFSQDLTGFICNSGAKQCCRPRSKDYT